MTDNILSSRPTRPVEDVKDLLARLYREIGISAVVAALEVTAKKAGAANRPARKDASEEAPSEAQKPGKDLAA